MRLVPYINGIAITNQGKGIQRDATSYPIITPPDTVKYPGWPRTLTINYGPPPGVADADGKTRSGIITATMDYYWHDLGTVTIIGFQNYYVNGSNFAGSLSVSRTSSTTFKVNGSGLVTGTGYTIIYNAGYWIFTWVSDVKDLKYADSQFTITGNGTGTDRNQVKFEYNTIAPLYKNGNCGYISSGNMSVEPSGLATRTITFNAGPSGCSNAATVTIGGQNYNISM